MFKAIDLSAVCELPLRKIVYGEIGKHKLNNIDVLTQELAEEMVRQTLVLIPLPGEYSPDPYHDVNNLRMTAETARTNFKTINLDNVTHVIHEIEIVDNKVILWVDVKLPIPIDTNLVFGHRALCERTYDKAGKFEIDINNFNLITFDLIANNYNGDVGLSRNEYNALISERTSDG